MTSPQHSVTTDDGRYYEWPEWPGRHFPSITTIIKQGTPDPILRKWEVKKAAETAIENIKVLCELLERARAHG